MFPERSHGCIVRLHDHAVLVPQRYREQLILGISENFLGGLAALRSPRDALMVFLTSVVIWLLETGKYWFVMHAFPFQVSFFTLMLMNGIVNLATTIPSAPGYVGTFDAPGIAVLAGLRRAAVRPCGRLHPGAARRPVVPDHRPGRLLSAREGIQLERRAGIRREQRHEWRKNRNHRRRHRRHGGCLRPGEAPGTQVTDLRSGRAGRRAGARLQGAGLGLVGGEVLPPLVRLRPPYAGADRRAGLERPGALPAPLHGHVLQGQVLSHSIRSPRPSCSPAWAGGSTRPASAWWGCT